MPDVVRLLAAINDAPTDALEIEDEVIEPGARPGVRIGPRLARGRRVYRLVGPTP